MMNRLRTLMVVALLFLVGCGSSEPGAPKDFTVSGHESLAALMALGDGYLQQMASDLELLASSDAARSADWEQIRGPLSAVAEHNVDALVWFALPDGSYWSVQGGKEAGDLSSRGYWPRLMHGDRVLGALVVSKATGRNTAVVAVPVRGTDGSLVGSLGSSIYLDSLSARIGQDLGVQPRDIFYSIDSTPLVALNGDPALILADPFELNEPDLERAITEMTTRDEGVVNYTFREKRRTVLYRKSAVTGWWYAFGHVWD